MSKARLVITAVLIEGRSQSQVARDYGVLLVDGPLAGICARAVVVIDETDVVRYTQLVDEITTEPDYEAALTALA